MFDIFILTYLSEPAINIEGATTASGYTLLQTCFKTLNAVVLEELSGEASFFICCKIVTFTRESLIILMSWATTFSTKKNIEKKGRK